MFYSYIFDAVRFFSFENALLLRDLLSIFVRTDRQHRSGDLEPPHAG